MSAESPLSKQDQRRLDQLYAGIRQAAATVVGYPCSLAFDYTPLFRFFRYPMNNAGDPYVSSPFDLNTHAFEREVLEVFRQLTHGPEDAFWGYVTSGGTEGNMYGLFLAREAFPNGIVYFSEDTDDSVGKLLRCLQVRSAMIKSLDDGRIDLEDLYHTIDIHRDWPPIILANIGTAVKGAVDDLDGIRQVLGDLQIPQHYIHCDAALSGMILPFVDNPQPWDFDAGVDSIAISGHKMVGSPFPCGVALANKNHVDRVARHVEYVGTLDTTISGSRNAIAPLLLWYAFRTVGHEGFRKRVQHCLEIADYAIQRLHEMGRTAWRHENSVTVVFDRPSAGTPHGWQLAATDELAQIVAMPHVTRELIDGLLENIAKNENNAKDNSGPASEKSEPPAAVTKTSPP